MRLIAACAVVASSVALAQTSTAPNGTPNTQQNARHDDPAGRQPDAKRSRRPQQFNGQREYQGRGPRHDWHRLEGWQRQRVIGFDGDRFCARHLGVS
jgi:Ni/Co efflux regulator RcnB